MQQTEERTTHLSPDEIARFLDLIKTSIEQAQEKGKRVEISITGGLYEWEEAGAVRRKTDGSREILISIPSDRLTAEPLKKE